jgi:hypothetical protein
VANFGAAALDVEGTQRCINAHTCKEGNPLMPKSYGGRYAEMMGLASLTMLESYEMKKRGHNWWIAPVTSIGMHGFGAAWSLRF